MTGMGALVGTFIGLAVGEVSSVGWVLRASCFLS